MIAVVGRVKRHWSVEPAVVIVRLVKTCRRPFRIIIVALDLWEGIDVFPVKFVQVWEVERGLREIYRAGHSAIVRLLEFKLFTVECKLLEVGRCAADDLEWRCRVDIASKSER